MKIKRIVIKNFRSIQEPLTIDSREMPIALVGPNNSGKSNVLRAIRLFFEARYAPEEYDAERDLPKNQKGSKTSIQITFSRGLSDRDENDLYRDAENEIWELYQQLRNLFEAPPKDDGTISITVVFNPSSPLYQVFPNTKKPEEASIKTKISRLQADLIDRILGSFSCYYIPSDYRTDEIYGNVFVAAVRERVAEVLKESLKEINDELKDITAQITSTLTEIGLSGYGLVMDVPSEDLSFVINDLPAKISDEHGVTGLEDKGLGIQSAVLLSSFPWIAQRSQNSGVKALWLIEEPESFLHPELLVNIERLLRKTAQNSEVFFSTHSLGMLPVSAKSIVGLRRNSEGSTAAETFTTYAKAGEIIRNNLGVEIGSFFGMSDLNILVEGKTDRELLEWFLHLHPSNGKWQRVRDAKVLEWGGVKNLEAFLMANLRFLKRGAPFVAIFDGDEAGKRAVSHIISRGSSQHSTTFENNLDYVYIKKDRAIEGLFPDSWIKDIGEANSKWIDIQLDAQDDIISYRISDNKKVSVQNRLKDRAEECLRRGDSSWNKNWVNLLNVLEQALSEKWEKYSRERDLNTVRF